MKTIELFIVEDQPHILKNQVKLLENFSELKIIGTAMTGADAVSKINGLSTPPDVVLCDLGLPDFDGSEVTKKVKAHHKKTEILIFTVFDEEDKVLEAVRAGASGYMLKGATADKIVENIKEVYQGGTVIQPNLARKLLRFFKQPESGRGAPGTIIPDNQYNIFREEGRRALTERELECLQMIAKGLSNNEAAGVLGLSKATIRTHLEHIYQKLDVTNRVEAVTEGIRQGIIEL